jgi:hypothetical protein
MSATIYLMAGILVLASGLLAQRKLRRAKLLPLLRGQR